MKKGAGDATSMVSTSAHSVKTSLFSAPPSSWLLLGGVGRRDGSGCQFPSGLFGLVVDSKHPYLSWLDEEENGFLPKFWPRPIKNQSSISKQKGQ